MIQASELECDILIVGGGLSGLSLAVELSDPRFAHLKVLVLERRMEYKRDRTWSFWRKAEHRYTDIERKQWFQWGIRHKGVTVAGQSTGWCYASIDADAFYAKAQMHIESCQHVVLRLGVDVESLTGKAHPHAQLTNGQTISAHLIFDARPPRQLSKGLAQHFVGWEITTKMPCFDPSALDLMDFQTHMLAGLHFMYVLPYSTTCALVESTWISEPLSQSEYDAELKHYIAYRWPQADYKVTYREQGFLPLEDAAIAQLADSTIVRIGRAGGTLRSSTGFAFMDTVAHAQKIAHAIAIGESVQTLQVEQLQFQRHKLDIWMDRVLFTAMRSDWGRAPAFFVQMFARVPNHALLEFLGGNGGMRCRLAVAFALPTMPFLVAAWMLLKAGGA
jgi:lycopene beta-cyclase